MTRNGFFGLILGKKSERKGHLSYTLKYTITCHLLHFFLFCTEIVRIFLLEKGEIKSGCLLHSGIFLVIICMIIFFERKSKYEGTFVEKYM